MKKMIDISIDLSKDTIVYPGDPVPKIWLRIKMANGDIANVGQMNVGTHHGTHLDVPFHFGEGKETVETIPLEYFFGDALVIDLTKVNKCITAADLSKVKNISKFKKVLFKTQNSLKFLKQKKFAKNFIYISGDAAEFLVNKGIKTVALDYITIDPYGSEAFPAHHTLLRAKIVVVEGVNLEKVSPGKYTFACFPVKIKNADGAPCRAVLMK